MNILILIFWILYIITPEKLFYYKPIMVGTMNLMEQHIN